MTAFSLSRQQVATAVYGRMRHKHQVSPRVLPNARCVIRNRVPGLRRIAPDMQSWLEPGRIVERATLDKAETREGSRFSKQG